MTTYTNDIDGMLLKIADGTGAPDTYPHDRYSQILRIADKVGAAAAGYSGDKYSQLKRIADQVGAVGTYTSDIYGQILKIADAGAGGTYTNDIYGQLSRIAVNGIGGGVTPYLGLVASRARPTTQNFALATVCARSAHFATDDITALKIAHGNWNIGLPDASRGSSLNITASVEYPSGTLTQIKFGGIATGTIPDKGTIFSDFASVSIPNGAQFWIRIFTSGAGCYLNQWQNTFLGEAISFGAAVADQTMSGSVSNANGGWSMPPLAILAQTVKPSVVIVGDSIGFGQNDVEDASASNAGFNAKVGVIARSLGSVPFLNLSVASINANGWATQSPGKKNILGVTSHLISQIGINDLRNSQTSAQLVSSLQAMWALATAVNSNTKIFQSTLTPISGSSDAWATTVNQTANATVTGPRTTFNNAVRSGLVGAAGFYNIASVFETAQNNDIWRVSPTPPYTPDGVHPTQSGYALVPPSGVITAPIYP